MSKNSIEKLKQKYSGEGSKNELIIEAITKKATGYVLEEITEEFLVDESGGMKLSKRKVVAKEVGPDINCVKALEELNSINKNKFENMTDEEHEKEKTRLINLILKEQEENK